MPRFFRAATFCIVFLFLPTAYAAKTIGILADGPGARSFVSIQALQAEVVSLTEGEFDVRFPSLKQLDGNWTAAGVAAALDSLLNDPNVDIVICVGALGSAEAARRPALSKPVIATLVVDAELQNYPLKDGVSGKRNFAYITNVQSIDDDLMLYHEVVDFKHVAILVEASMLKGFSDFSVQKAEQLRELLGVDVTPIPVSGPPLNAVAAIPEYVDAVFVTPLLRFNDEEITVLADALNARKLPTFSSFGVTELYDGMLLAAGGRPEDNLRLIRRLALNIQRILLGDKASEIPVGLQESRRIAINMQTAKAIGFAPRFVILAEAEQLFSVEDENSTPMSLLQAMNRAAEENLGLKVAGSDPLIAGADAKLARSDLLPQFQLQAGARKIDDDRAIPGFQAEKSTDIEAQGSQLIYGDDQWARYRVSTYLQAASDEAYRAALLDTLQSSGLAYLNVLRLQALEDVQRSNLEVTRTNLELARVRESIGFSGRADLLRWESQIATARRQLIEATANRRQSENQLLQILNLPQSTPVAPQDASVEKTLAMFTQPRFEALIDNALTWQTFQDFVVETGIENSPDIAQLDQQLLAGERQVTAAKRRYWLPTFNLDGFVGRNLDRSGAGSNWELLGIDERTWQLGVNARLPVFNGGALRADLNKQRYGLRQAEDQRAFIEQDVETRIRVSLEQVSSSYSAIDLTAEAARASTENLEIIIDAYSKGARSVTDLINAQNNTLFAELSAAQAKYVYLGDVINVLRESSDFDLMLDAQNMNAWYLQVEEFFNERGIVLAY